MSMLRRDQAVLTLILVLGININFGSAASGMVSKRKPGNGKVSSETAFSHIKISTIAPKQNDTLALEYHKKATKLVQEAHKYQRLKQPLQATVYYQQSTKYFNKAIKASPENKELSSIFYNNIGIIYMEIKKYENAEKSFSKAIQLNPKNASVYNNLGTLFYTQKKLSSAIKNFKKAVDLNPNESRYCYNLATAYYSAGLQLLAAEYQSKALKITPIAQIKMATAPTSKQSLLGTTIVEKVPTIQKFSYAAPVYTRKSDSSPLLTKGDSDAKIVYDIKPPVPSSLTISENKSAEQPVVKPVISLPISITPKQPALATTSPIVQQQPVVSIPSRVSNPIIVQRQPVIKENIYTRSAYPMRVLDTGYSEANTKRSQPVLPSNLAPVKPTPPYETTGPTAEVKFSQPIANQHQSTYETTGTIASLFPDKTPSNQISLPSVKIAKVEDFSSYKKTAEAYLKQGYYSLAIEYFKKYIEMQPNSDHAYTEMGMAYIMRAKRNPNPQDLVTARDILNIAVSINPNNLEANNILKVLEMVPSI